MDPGSLSKLGNSGSGRNRDVASRPDIRDFDMSENDAGHHHAQAVGGDTCRLTFKALLIEGRRRARHGEPFWNAIASNEAALRSFARANGLGDEDTFTPLLGVSDEEFRPVLQAFEFKTTLAVETIGPYRSRLRSWNATARSLLQKHEPDLFAEVLSKGLSAYLAKNPGVTRTDVAERAGTTLQRLYRWTKPGFSQASNAPSTVSVAGRLETVLGLPASSLTSKLAPKRRKGRRHKDVEAKRKARLARVSLTAIKFRPERLPGRIGTFFDRLTMLKTTVRIVRNAAGTSIKRAGKTWRVVPNAEDPIPARTIMESLYRTYVGWLLLPDTPEGARAFVAANCQWRKKKLESSDVTVLSPFFVGKAIPVEDLAPAHLVDPELIGEFIEWYKNRHGAIDNQWVRNAIALLEPARGFLAQQVECVWCYEPAGITPVEPTGPQFQHEYATATQKWGNKCAAWSAELKELLPFTKMGRSRAARDKLKPIFDQRDLMAVVNTIIESHASDRPVGKLVAGWSGSVLLAVWVRDQLLLRMLASNPLRSRNFKEMRWVEKPNPQDRGNLYRAADGSWRLHFEPSDFKNERGAAKEAYDVAVPRVLHPLIELYLTKARPILLRSAVATDRVFISRDGDPFKGAGLGSVVLSLTGRHVQDDIDSLGFRAHAFRHIVATAWLRAHPKDYLTVAHILHDSLQTVLDNYAHHKPGDGLELYNDWLSTKIPPINLDRMQ